MYLFEEKTRISWSYFVHLLVTEEETEKKPFYSLL